MLEKQITRTRYYRAGYAVHSGRWSHDGGDEDPWTPMRWATNPSGEYIGNPKDAYFLCRTKGIAPVVRPSGEPGHTCSIGYCAEEKKWYGWSHRAIFGFGIGYVAREGQLPTTSGWTEEYLEEHPEEDRRVPVGFEVKSLEDAKRVAIAFAESVD
jgi:hypothetical protein